MVVVYKFMVICLIGLCGGCIVTCECAKKFWPKARKGKGDERGREKKKNQTNKQFLLTNASEKIFIGK